MGVCVCGRNEGGWWWREMRWVGGGERKNKWMNE